MSPRRRKMKALVVYDSMYGNTETLAKAIGSAITGEVNGRHAGEVSTSDLQSIDLLVVGSPTQGGRPTKAIQDFVNEIGEPLRGLNVAVFDTRLSTKWVGVFGHAAERIADALQKRGGILAAPPGAFVVGGKEGPLKDGETVRAAEWGRELSEAKG